MVVGGHGRVLTNISQNCQNRRKLAKIEKKKFEKSLFRPLPGRIWCSNRVFRIQGDSEAIYSQKTDMGGFFQKKSQKTSKADLKIIDFGQKWSKIAQYGL